VALAGRWLLNGCFLLSGFTALLYQTVWMRLALARFGVNTSVIATVLTVFMLGLTLGTVLAGRYVERAEARFGLHGLRLYGLAELAVGLGGWVVPSLFAWARGALLSLGAADSASYGAASTALIAVVLLPFCTAMGLTFPTAISFLRRAEAAGGERKSFSALYLANVLGALAGALLTPLVLIEAFGFLATSYAAACLNVLLACAALLAFRRAALPAPATVSRAAALAPDPEAATRRGALFVTGFCTMGMEVLWTRIYPPYIGTFVYSFAGILATYLVATSVGSAAYRRLRDREASASLGILWPWLSVASLLPLLTASVGFAVPAPLRIVVGLAPFCALLGYLTPSLVDREAGDDPARLGRAYGLNLLGCVLGPIVAGFLLIPVFGNRVSALLLAAPLFLFLLPAPIRKVGNPLVKLGAVALGAAVFFSTTLFEDVYPREQVRNDRAATTVAAGKGLGKILYVNGVGMTCMAPITKMMAHFPAAHLSREPERRLDALVICFGIGTTFRSLASWGANVTAVELIPSVPSLFGFYFPEGPALVAGSGGRLRIEIDDGRRFLDRSREQYDMIAVDPPPPVEAAASSLLYTKEFYASAIPRLKTGGILQAWLPGADRDTVAAVTEAILESFPHVRVFRSRGDGGYEHLFLASMQPIPRLTERELLLRMPEAAAWDMMEWQNIPAIEYLRAMLNVEVSPESAFVDGSRMKTAAIRDDRPVNEFFFMRRFLRRES
jgi:spermidine synthase